MIAGIMHDEKGEDAEPGSPEHKSAVDHIADLPLSAQERQKMVSYTGTILARRSRLMFVGDPMAGFTPEEWATALV